MDFHFYWSTLKKYKWPILLFVVLMAAGAIYYSRTATPVYAASATLLIESQEANVMSVEELVTSEQESLDYYGTQFAILKSRGLAERVIRQLELSENISLEDLSGKFAPSPLQQVAGSLSQLTGMLNLGGILPGSDAGSAGSPSVDVGNLQEAGVTGQMDRERREQMEEAIKQFSRSLQVKPVAKTKLVTIIYESTDPEFSALTANMVASQYIESVIERRESLEGKASEWMDQRIAELKLRLDESEEVLLDFKKENGLVELEGGVSRLGEQELMLRSAELAEARSELSSAGDLYRKIQSYESSSPELLETLPFVQSDMLVRSVKTELGQAQRDLVEAQNRYGDKHPRIIDTRSRLESLRSTLDGHIDRIVATFESDYQLLQQRVESLEATLAEGKENIQLIGQKSITLSALEREVEANRDLYNRLFDRITETRTADGLDQANAVLTDAAWAPTDPVKPNKGFIIAFVTLFSLFLAAALAFLVEYLDDTVSSADDVERRLKTKLLGVLPLVERIRSRKGKDSSLPLTPEDVIETSDTFLEAVRTCRTGLSIKNKDLQVILVTSSVPDEGKSTVALNLAYSFGKLERTLLIDCDLRRPSVAHALGLSTTVPGLTNLLLEKSKDCLRHDVLGSFDCLTSGPMPDQPLELLSSANFAKVMESLRRRYDKIIIDSPPTHVVSDAIVLSKLSDSVLYVVKPHTTSMKLIDSGLSRLSDAGASVAGVCISQLNIEKQKSYSGFEFHGLGTTYHGYGDRYAHSERV